VFPGLRIPPVTNTILDDPARHMASMETALLKIVRTLPVLAVVVAAAACGSQIPQAADVPSLSESLRAAGLKVSPPAAMGRLDAALFEAEGSLLVASSEKILAYQFKSEEAATQAAAKVSPDGSGIGNTYVNWSAVPHFYRSGRLIAVYDGEQSLIVSTLAAAMGSPFAGGDAAGDGTPSLGLSSGR
jgi:hypothetical protein